MRVLLLNQFYPPDPAATGQLLADVAEALVAEGHEVQVLCSSRAYGGGDARYPAREEVRGVRIRRVGATGFGRRHIVGRLCDYLSFYVLAMGVALTLPRMDACVALTTPPFIGIVGALLRMLRGTRLILWTMDLYPQVVVAFGKLDRKSALLRFLQGLSRWLHGHADCVIALGEFMKKRLIEADVDRNKIWTIHNWVPRDAVRSQPVETAALRGALGLDGRVALMYSGNLGLGHDLETIVRAAALLDPALGVRILFVGGGNMRTALEQLSGEMRLDCVSFHPPQPLDRLSQSLAAGDMHYVAQRPGTEGLIVPSKLYGVMAAARPVIFSGPENCEAAWLVWHSGAGVVVPPESPGALAEAVQTLAADPAMRADMGRRGRAYYDQHFGIRHSTQRIVRAINRTLQVKKAG